MGCLSCLAACVLVLVNIIFLLVGIALVAVGAIGLWGQALLETVIKAAFNVVALTQTESDIKLPDPKFILQAISSIAIALLVIGIFFFIIAIFGMCGACCKSKCLLYSYGGIVLVIFAVQFGALIYYLAAKSQVYENLKTYCYSALNNYQDGTMTRDNSSVETYVANLIQYGLQCCGVQNGTDYLTLTWYRNLTYSNHKYNLVFPVSCCNADYIQQCVQFPGNTNYSYVNIGCFNLMRSNIENYAVYIAGIVGGVCIVELILAILGFAIGCAKNKVAPV